MIKQKNFNDSQEINFLISFYFFQELYLSVFVDLKKKFSPESSDSIGVNFEVLKFLH